MLARQIPARFFKPTPAANYFPRFSPLDHLFIIRALALRELRTRHNKLRIGFMIEFVQPLVVLFLHYYVFLVLGKFMPGEIPVEIYVLGGFTTWFTFRDIAKRTSRTDGRPPLLIPGVTPKEFHYLGAAIAWQVTANILLLYLGLFLCQLIFGDEPLPNLPASILVFLIAALLGTGARLVFDALIEVWPLVKGAKKAIIFMLFITSGIYFSLQQPARDALQIFAWYNPLDHLIESQRHALYPGYPISQVTLLYPTAWGLGLILLGLSLKQCLPRWLPR